MIKARSYLNLSTVANPGQIKPQSMGFYIKRDCDSTKVRGARTKHPVLKNAVRVSFLTKLCGKCQTENKHELANLIH